TFRFLSSSRFPALKIITGIVETPNGDVWLQTRAGILRIARTSLLRALSDPSARLDFRLFDTGDGFAGSAYDLINRNFVAGPDGRIWLLMTTGLAWIDPGHLYRNREAPPVVITSLGANGRLYGSPPDVALEAGTSRVQIDYTALSLMKPERV